MSTTENIAFVNIAIEVEPVLKGQRFTGVYRDSGVKLAFFHESGVVVHTRDGREIFIPQSLLNQVTK